MERGRPSRLSGGSRRGRRREKSAVTAVDGQGSGRARGVLQRAPLAATDSSPPRWEEEADLTPAVSANLRRLRARRELSLEALSRLSGVSRAMLGQIELQQSTPTINVLWKIARALNVPFSALIAPPSDARAKLVPAARAKILTSRNGAFSSRALFPFDGPRKAEFYELRLAAHSVEEAEPHPPGTVENLVLTDGSLEIRVAGESHVLSPGDAIQFEADVPHEYRNPGDRDAVMYLVMTYADEVG